MSEYDSLADADKIKIGIDYVARGVEMPRAIRDFLISIELYEPIINPKGE